MIFVDTDAVTSEIFAWLYLRETSKIMKEYIKKQVFDLIIFLDHENTLYEKDEIRILGDHRSFNSEFIKNSFNFYKKKFIEFDNKEGYKAREEKVQKKILETFGLSLNF
jgi:nicotinamide riboside kinase